MHIFLTGEINTGKSFVISKTLPLLKAKIGGFQTYFGLQNKIGEKILYMNSADAPMSYRRENEIVYFSQSNPPKVMTDKFDSYGVDLIRTARTTADLIIMDECGFLERDAIKFQNEILDALDGNTPIFGVIKLAKLKWSQGIRNHSKVKIITVDFDNRDMLPQKLAAELATELNHGRI